MTFSISSSQTETQNTEVKTTTVEGSTERRERELREFQQEREEAFKEPFVVKTRSKQQRTPYVPKLPRTAERKRELEREYGFRLAGSIRPPYPFTRG